MKVLFTAVGKSDPMTIFENCEAYDGSIMHICRNYLPDKVIMYMSKDICEFDSKDDRYSRSIEYLGKLLGHKFEIEKISRPELTDVFQFDAFYEEFELITNNIINKYGVETDIYFNVSSGTPAMKSALQIIAAMAKYDITAIQVVDPTAGKYARDIDLENYNLDEYWSSNNDNNTNTKRCYASENNIFNFKVQKEIITNMIKKYEYEAVNDLILDNAFRFNKEVLDLSAFAVNRFKLNKNKYLVLQKEINYELIPYKQSDLIELFEYGLWLKIKVNKGDLLDVVRGINPFMYSACNMLLKQKYNIDIENYLYKNKLKRDLLNQDDNGRDILYYLDKDFNSDYNDTYLTEKQMITYIKYKIPNDKFTKNILELDKFREKLRNIASHQITSVVKEDINRKLNHDIEYYVDCIKKILTLLGYDTKENWDSYEKMNDYFISKILE